MTKTGFLHTAKDAGVSWHKGPEGSAAFLKLAETAVDRPSFNSKEKVSASGRAQAVALQFGKGRVVVLGEAAMLTAQVLWIRGVNPSLIWE